MEASRPLASPVRTGNLVLKTRIALVIRNLKHLQLALATVKQRRTYLRQVLMFPDLTEVSVERLGEALNRAVDGYERGSWGDIKSLLETLGVELDKLNKGVSALKGPVSELRTAAMLDEDELARTNSVANAVHQSLKNAVSSEFGDKLANLETLRDKIDTADQEGKVDAEAMRAAWTEYSDRLYKSSERLFQEYVNLVSGVALRDTGVDRGIARLAEDLLKPGGTIGSFTWNTLTIPAREEALAVTASRIVRLGFPEWTIWMLPLAAYELGSNYADSDKKVAERIDELGGDKDELFVLVADAFATYFLGPAYACAAILMRLNPAQAFSGNRLIAKRAAIILSAMTQMSKNASGVQDHYAEITSRLAVEWEDALRQTGWDGSIDDDEIVDGDDRRARSGWRPLTGLTVDEQTAIDRLLHAFEPLVHAWILSDIEAWPKVEEWATRLRCGQELHASDLGDLAELRYVLNAAWRARIAVRLPEADVDDMDELAKITLAVEKLLWTLVRGSKQPTTTSDAGQQRPPLQVIRYQSDRRAQPGRESA